MPGSGRFSRRRFLQWGGLSLGAWALGTKLRPGWPTREERPEIPGRIVGANFKLGHRLRTGDFPPITRHARAGVVIVGGGMAGLSTAWRLEKRGYDDFRVLELEDEVGGNSRSGEAPASPYPWGAHYVPIPGPALVHVRELFEELGVIEGYDAHGKARYNEYHLCAAPQERLYLYGRWQEGLLPQSGITAQDRDEYSRFFAEMERFRATRGSDGRRAFELPVDLSSRDPRFTALDQISFASYLDEKGYGSPALRWYLDYCCRDDYGSRLGEVSAWAGIHYFAARNGTDASTEGTVLTWPEGNGWLVKRLTEKLSSHLDRRALVYRVTAEGAGAHVDYFDASTGESVRVRCDGVCLATPRFLAARLMGIKPAPEFTYAPWMVANLTCERPPGGKGAPLAWDNVLFDSPGLGYVVATHQSLRLAPAPTVLTYYRPLCDAAPDIARRSALDRTYPEWRTLVLSDLGRAHPDLSRLTKRLDVWLWGHGMIRPTPGFITGEARRRPPVTDGRIVFAHSDMSGLSLFEEAQYRGVRAADELITRLGGVPAA